MLIMKHRMRILPVYGQAIKSLPSVIRTHDHPREEKPLQSEVITGLYDREELPF